MNEQNLAQTNNVLILSFCLNEFQINGKSKTIYIYLLTDNGRDWNIYQHEKLPLIKFQSQSF